MTWTDLALGTVALALMIMVPGYAVSRSGSARPLPAVAVSPVVGLGLVAIVAHLYRAFGVSWSVTSWLLAASVITAVPTVIAIVRKQLRLPRFDRREWFQNGAVVGGVCVAGAIQAWVFLRALVVPNAVHVGWDGIYHLSGVRAVMASGDASVFAMSNLYENATITYPSGFHAIAGLLPWLGAEGALNAVIILACCLFLPLGIAGLATQVFPAYPLVAVFAPVTAAWLMSLPAIVFGERTALPAGLGGALVPAFLCLVWVAAYPRLCATLLTPLAIAALGLAFIQPATVVGAILMALPPAIVVGGRFVTAAFRSRNWIAIGLMSFAAGFGLTLIRWLAANPRIQSVANYPRAVTGESDIERLALAITDRSTLFGEGAQAWIIPMLVLIGAAFALTGSRSRPLIGTWVIVMVLAVGAMKVDWWGSLLSGLFYNDYPRILALLPAPAGIFAGAAIVLIGVAVTRIATKLRASIMLAATVGLLSMFLIAVWVWEETGRFREEEKISGLEFKYVTPHTEWMTTVVSSWEEIEFIRQTAESLPANSVVIGNSHSGSSLFFSLGNINSYPKALNTFIPGTAEHYLVQNFRDYLVDEDVCEAVNELGATHVFLKPVAYAEGMDSNVGRPGFFDVPKEGLSPYVMFSDDVGLWRIEACD